MARFTPTQLAKADKEGEKKVKHFRDLRRRAFMLYMGAASNENRRKKRPINPTAQAINTLQAALTPRELTHRVESKRVDLRGEATLRQAAIDRLSKELGLVAVYGDVIMDALCGPCGIVKVGLRAADEMAKIIDTDIDPGQLYIARVDLDDYAIDPMARHRSEAYWERHKYRIPRWMALESGVFAGHEDVIARLPSIDENHRDRDSADTLTGDEQYEHGSNVCDLIELVDYAIYEGETARIVTLPVTGKDEVDGSKGYLHESEYQGPEGSCYDMLTFFRVPNNVFGIPLASMFQDLSEAIDQIGSKMIREGLKAKKVFAAEKGSAEDAKTIMDAPDQRVVLVDNIDSVKEFENGGVIKDLYTFHQFLRAEFNNASLSSQMIGGTDSLADTATEASILQGNANDKIQWMRAKVAGFMARNARRIGWYMQHDPMIAMPLPYRMRGGESVTIMYTPEMREGDFEDFTFDYAVDTMASTDPAVKSKRLQEAMATFTAGLQPIAAVGGDPAAWARIIGEKFDCPELDEVINGPEAMMRRQMAASMVPDAGQGQPMGGPPGMGGGPMGAPGMNQMDQTRQAYAPAMAEPAMQGAY